MKVSALTIYPIKSCAGIAVSQAQITVGGFVHDRRYLLVDHAGRFMTQRKYPKMALLQPFFDTSKPNDPTLWLKIPNASAEPILADVTVSHSTVRVWADTVSVTACFAKLSQKISLFLGVPCQLVCAAKDYARRVRDCNEPLSFADSFPFLLMSSASLQDLNKRLSMPATMQRFRPNIVLSGATAYAEDAWRSVNINGVSFYGGQRCSRCALPEVNPQTGERDAREITQILRAYRSDEKGLWYLGRHFCAVERAGVIRVGDVVIAL